MILPPYVFKNIAEVHLFFYSLIEQNIFCIYCGPGVILVATDKMICIIIHNHSHLKT